MSTTIYLIRHGELKNPEQIIYGDMIEMQMTDKGREEIRKLGLKILKAEDVPSKIYSSPMERTVESSNILAEIWDVADIQLEKGLMDSHEPGIEGKPMSILEEIYRRGIDEYSEEFVKAGGETKEEIAQRMMNVFRKAEIENKGRCVAIVSHGDPIFLFTYKLENPNVLEIPYTFILKKDNVYPKKGYAWKLTLSEDGKLLKKGLISPD